MKSWICGFSLLAFVLAAGLASRSTRAAADGPESIEKIMQALHKGKKSPMATLKGALKSASPDWSVVQKEARTYAKLAADMPKNSPPKGEDAAYKKLARSYAGHAKALAEAVKKEDLTAAKSAFGKIGGSCMGCHKAHRED